MGGWVGLYLGELGRVAKVRAGSCIFFGGQFVERSLCEMNGWVGGWVGESMDKLGGVGDSPEMVGG